MSVDVALIIMNRDRPDITDRVYEQVSGMGDKLGLSKRIFVVECGSKEPEGCSRYMTHRFEDKHYKGRYYGFNQGLKIAHTYQERYRYYWFVVNDIVFDESQDALSILAEAMEEDERMACIGPGEPESDDYKGCHPRPGRRWHKVSTIHGLAMLMRGQALHEVGYCNPAFHYSQGAGTELSYKLYKNGWFMAYSDIATVTHAGGSTYGVVTKISRHEYQRRARNFASRYLARHYGQDWDKRFSAVLPEDVTDDNFAWQKEVWERKLKRNWKECCPWFWQTGSRLKQLFR